ncbi:MAG: hypothetical protein GF332_02430 [Candidatus Moranbacteria bacterium]|nr:hypothetical protein [Candidatus Moranbacteria bacterium]
MFEQIIPPALMILSAALILYLFGRKVPDTIKNLGKAKQGEEQEGFDVKEAKEKFGNFLEKFLRRLKIIILKSDAKLMQAIKTLQDKKKQRIQLEEAKKKEIEEEQRKIEQANKAEQNKVEKVKQEPSTQPQKETTPLTAAKTTEEELATEETDEEQVEESKGFFSKFKNRFKKSDSDQQKQEVSQEKMDKLKQDIEELEAMEQGTEEKEEKKKTPLMEKMNEIRQKLTGMGSEAEQRSQEDQAVARKTKSKKAKQGFDLDEARRVMFERQEEVLIKRISNDPGDDKNYVELGKLYIKADNVEDAIASFNQALKINRGNITAKKFLKQIKNELG